MAEADLVLKRTSAEHGVLYDLSEALGKRLAAPVAAGRAVTKAALE